MTTDHMIDTTACEAALDAAHEAYAEANLRLAALALWMLAAKVHNEFPTATAMALTWSDSREPCLSLAYVTLPDDADEDARADAEDWYDDHAHASCLDEGNESAWLPFAAPDENGDDAYFTFDLATILATDPTKRETDQ